MSTNMELSPAGWTAIGGVLVAAITGFIAWINGRNSSVAVLQNALVSGFKELNEQRSDAMTAMRTELDELKAEVLELKGEVAKGQSRENALKNMLRANGIEIPREKITQVVFAPFPDATPSEGTL